MAKKKLKSEIWEETPWKPGVYRNIRTGKLAIATASEKKGEDWEIDKGKIVNHPLFRIKQHVTQYGTGNYFFNRCLKGFEFIQEDITGFEAGKIFVPARSEDGKV